MKDYLLEEIAYLSAKLTLLTEQGFSWDSNEIDLIEGELLELENEYLDANTPETYI
jgi:hypothetical protein